MSAANGSAIPGETSDLTPKGKGKAVQRGIPEDMEMEEDETSEEESGNEEAVSSPERFREAELFG